MMNSAYPDRQELIRFPAPVRIFVASFGGVFCGILLFGVIVAALKGTWVFVIPLGMLAFSSVLFYRSYRLSVELRPDELVVHNYWRTLHVGRVQVQEFQVRGVRGQLFTTCVDAVLNDHSKVTLDAIGGLPLTARGREDVQRHLDRLRDWLAS